MIGLSDSHFLVPKCLNSSLLCCIGHLEGDSPCVTSFHSNGFVYEFKNKKLISNLFIGVGNVESFSMYYVTEERSLVRYYIMFKTDKTLLIFKKANSSFQITTAFENVENFKVFDFMSLGFPQIKISFKGNSENRIFDFMGMKIESSHLEQEKGSKKFTGSPLTLATYLNEKLQMMNRCIDELLVERNMIKNSIKGNDLIESNFITPKNFLRCPENQDDAIKTSLDKNPQPSPDIVLTEMWQQNYKSYLIFGMRLLNLSDELLPDVKVIVNEKNISKFLYAFFSIPRPGEWPLKAPPNILPKQEILLIGAFKRPTLVYTDVISAECFLTWRGRGDNIKIGVINSDSLTLWNQCKVLTLEKVSDILSMMVVLKEYGLLVESDCRDNDLLKNALGKLGFERSRIVAPNFFYSSSNNVAVHLDQISAFPHAWKLRLFVRNCRQLYFFLNALYSVLPDKTPVLYRKLR